MPIQKKRVTGTRKAGAYTGLGGSREAQKAVIEETTSLRVSGRKRADEGEHVAHESQRHYKTTRLFAMERSKPLGRRSLQKKGI